jgi:hypothetical protein
MINARFFCRFNEIPRLTNLARVPNPFGPVVLNGEDAVDTSGRGSHLLGIVEVTAHDLSTKARNPFCRRFLRTPRKRAHTPAALKQVSESSAALPPRGPGHENNLLCHGNLTDFSKTPTEAARPSGTFATGLL